MAGEFPITSTTRSLPGRAPGAFGSTGAQLPAIAMQQFGGALLGVGVVENRIQADTELAQAVMADRRAINDLAFRLEQNSDPHTYQEELRKTLEEIQGREIKNGLASREHTRWVRNMTPDLEKSVKAATNLRIQGNYQATLFEAQTAAIQSPGNMATFQALLAEGVTANYIAEDKAARLMAQVTHDSQRRMVEETAMRDPDAALEFLRHFEVGDTVGFEALTVRDAQDLRQIALGFKNYRAAQFEAKKDEVGRKMLVSLWEGKLTDLREVTEALDRNLITTTMAKSLREAMLKPQPAMPAEQFLAEAQVRDEINRYQAGDIEKQEALEFLYSKAGVLGQAKGSSMLNKLYDEPDKALAEMKREGKSLMEEYIRTRDKFSGFFTDNKQEIMGTAEAVLLLDIEIEKAQRAKKPLGRRDIIIKAMEIGQQVRTKIDKMGKKEIPAVPVELGQQVLVKTDKTITAGTVAIAPDGSVWGSHNGDGTITLNDYGVRALLGAANNNGAEARKLATERGLVIPKVGDTALTGELGTLNRPGGGVSTEISITVTDKRLNNGRPTNIPTLVKGQVNVNALLRGDKITKKQEEIAIKRAIERVARGGTLPSYNTIDEAVQAAIRRSKEK